VTGVRPQASDKATCLKSLTPRRLVEPQSTLYGKPKRMNS
jgi:hypothetical protein